MYLLPHLGEKNTVIFLIQKKLHGRKEGRTKRESGEGRREEGRREGRKEGRERRGKEKGRKIDSVERKTTLVNV